MRLTLTRVRFFIVAALAVAGISATVTLLSPSGQSEALDTAEPRSDGLLLISEFREGESTLFLVDPSRPDARQEFSRVPHAEGWELVGSVSPTGDTFAYLVLPPRATDQTLEMALAVQDDDGVRFVSTGFDIGGGLLWSADGESVFLRRSTGGDLPTQWLVEIDIESSVEELRFQAEADFGLYAVAKPEDGTLYVAVINTQGSEFIVLSEEGQAERTVKLSGGVIRDWALSPDGSKVAFTEQRGLKLDVRVVGLFSDRTTLAAADDLNGSLAGAPAGGSAAPAWHPDGSLSVGTFGESGGGAVRLAAGGESVIDWEPGEGFILPVAWSEDGAHLALRAFSGSGPGAVGQESAAVMGPGGHIATIHGEFVTVLGWWYGSD
jgi:hypothetical protein